MRKVLALALLALLVTFGEEVGRVHCRPTGSLCHHCQLGAPLGAPTMAHPPLTLPLPAVSSRV